MTEKEILVLFENLSESDKIEILTKALQKKCGKEHMNYLIIQAMDKFAYTDLWCDDKNGFYWNKYK